MEASTPSLGKTLLVAWMLLWTSPAHARDTGARVFLLGLDGLSWRILSPLLDQGRMPNVGRCLQRGSHGKLRSLASSFSSPALWTTVATGTMPPKHGILDFMKGGQTPYTSEDRKVPALWNILSDRRRTTLVVNYFSTYPVEPINGVMVSKEFNDRDKPAPVFPEKAQQRLVEARVNVPGDPAAIRKRFTGSEPPSRRAAAAATPEDAFIDRKLDLLREIHVGDETYAKIAEALLSKRAYDLFLFHLWGADSAAHLFGHFSPFDGRPVSESLRRQLGQVLGNYYAYADEVVGRLMKHADDKTAVLILSDHGMMPKPTFGKTTETAPNEQFWTHDMSDGVLIACGSRIRKGDIDGASILDIAPTVLYLEDLPAAATMDGRVLEGMLDPDLVRERPPARIKAYPFKRPSPSGRSRMDPKLMETLRNMGYLE